MQIRYRVQKRWHHKKLFLDFSVLDTMYRWSMMKNIHSPNWVGIGSWGPELWPHEYLISPTEISVNWSGSKQLWTRPIYTDFNGANWVFMRPYLRPPWTNSCQFWCVRVFSSCSTEILSWKYWNAKKKIWWRHTSVLYETFHNWWKYAILWREYTAMDIFIILETGLPLYIQTTIFTSDS